MRRVRRSRWLVRRALRGERRGVEVRARRGLGGGAWAQVAAAISRDDALRGARATGPHTHIAHLLAVPTRIQASRHAAMAQARVRLVPRLRVGECGFVCVRPGLRAAAHRVRMMASCGCAAMCTPHAAPRG
eukprot:2876829-Prymnesium_polylepis.1